jgi:lipid II:glycine glycyltransferase (peptidoglycan interpeptide bridge formation enzyme)
MSHFLQSKAWGDFQESLGKKVFYQSGADWSFMAILEKGRFNTRLYCPYGPDVQTKAGFDEALEMLIALGREHHATFIRIEPTGNVTSHHLKSRRLRKVTYAKLQPEHTQVIDLSPPEEEIISNMQQTARNLYRNYAKKDIAMHQSTDPKDIDILLRFIRRVAERNRVSLQSDSYLKKQAEILMPSGNAKLFYATVNDEPIAAALVYDDNHTRYYAHAGANDAYRKLQAGTSLLAYLIVDAKRAGLRAVDLSGIAPTDDPQHPWAGFTRFKKSFGGSPFTYLGLWELPLQPLRYALYRFLQSLFK